MLLAFGLTILAGLSTGIGSALAFFTKRTNTRFLSFALGFSAGVMIYVSFVEILAKARQSLVGEFGIVTGSSLTAGAFFLGILLIAIIDKLVPGPENPHELRCVEEMHPENGFSRNDGLNHAEHRCIVDQELHKQTKLHRMGLFTALAIGIHNFPEGLATFTAALTDPALGIAIAVAIAIHNIPEGIAVSVPIYYATGSRKKAFLYSFMSGLAEPVGAIVGFAILRPFFSPLLFGVLFAVVAGIMVFISLDELLPAAKEYGEHHLCTYGMISGMALMAGSLLLFL